MNGIGISVDAWAAWAPGIETHEDWVLWSEGGKLPELTGKPAIDFVPPMFRRRLSRLGKMAVFTAHQCGLDDNLPSTRYLFASRYGENERTVGIIDNIVEGRDVSPTAFSLSVHNAIAGIYSIVEKDTRPSASLSAGRNTFIAAWTEAEQLLKSASTDCDQILLVYYDEPLTNDLASFSDDVSIPFSIALRLTLSTDSPNQISLVSNAEDIAVSDAHQQYLSTDSQALNFLRLLLAQNKASMNADCDNRWVWQRT